MTTTSAHSGSIAEVDHHPQCGGVGTTNCWHLEPSTFTGIWATPRGTLATDSSGCVYTGSSPVGQVVWTKQTALGCGLTNPQYDGSGVLYALDTGSGNLKFVEDNSGTWEAENGAVATQFSTAASGDLFYAKINSAHALNVTSNPEGSWTAMGSGYVYVQAMTSQSWYAVKTDGTVWYYNNGTWYQVGTSSNAVQVAAAMALDLGGNPMVYYLGSDGCVYHRNSLASSGWDKMNGCGVTSIAARGQLDVWALHGSSLYRLGDITQTFTFNYSGTVTCNVPPPYNQQICPTFTHTANATASWGTKGSHTVNATPWNNSGQWGLTVTTDVQDDPIGCLDNPLMDGCTPSDGGNMNCSGGGSDNTGSDFTVGLSVDVSGWLYDDPGYPIGPTLISETGYQGEWTGTDHFHHSDRCTAGYPTCTSNPSLAVTASCAFNDLEQSLACYEIVNLSITRVSIASPFVVRAPYLKQNSTGLIVCVPPHSVQPTLGNPALVPSCQ